MATLKASRDRRFATARQRMRQVLRVEEARVARAQEQLIDLWKECKQIEAQMEHDLIERIWSSRRADQNDLLREMREEVAARKSGIVDRLRTGQRTVAS